MSDAARVSARTPWHLWIVAILGLLWNSIGAVDFTLTQLKNELYLKSCTPEQLEYFSRIPLWVVGAWGLGVYGGFLGSIFLLLRRRWAVWTYGGSLVGAVLTPIYSYGMSDGLKIMGGGAGPIVFSAVIVVIAALLLVYARAQAARGVLD